VDRQERCPGHAVLQPGRGRKLKRAPPARKPHVERADVSPERQDLRPIEVKPSRCHVTSPPASGHAQTEGMTRVKEHAEGRAGLVLVLSRAEIEHCRPAAAKVAGDHIKVHLLGTSQVGQLGGG
jgi:hypothetical protein